MKFRSQREFKLMQINVFVNSFCMFDLHVITAVMMLNIIVALLAHSVFTLHKIIHSMYSIFCVTSILSRFQLKWNIQVSNNHAFKVTLILIYP